MEQEVKVDIKPMSAPEDEVDLLTTYLQGEFLERRETLKGLLDGAKSLRFKEDVVKLGYEVIQFRMDLDTWVAFTDRLLTQALAEQMEHAHHEKKSEAREDKLKRPSAELVRVQAQALVAPLQEALDVLKETRNWMSSILSWCQSQQRFITTEEYGDVWQQNQINPKEFISSQPPSPANAISRQKGINS